MTKLNLPYVHRTVDRHGNVYFHFRKVGSPRTRLPNEFGSKIFLEAYAEALEQSPKQESNPYKVKSGSMAALATAWYQSALFKRLREDTTQTVYRRTIESFLIEHGEKAVTHLEARHVRSIIAAKADTPAAANQLLKRLKQLMHFALENDWIKVDPTQGVRSVRYSKKPIHTWTEEEATQYSEFHGADSKAYLAFMILSHTGVRRSDLVKLGRGNLRKIEKKTEGGVVTEYWLAVDQVKTDEPVMIPVHQNLIPILLAIKDRILFMQTAYGKPFTANGFGGWFRDQCDKAQLPQCSAHGLRKLIAKRLAEAGASENTISAILGWTNNDQAALYTREANKEKMARAGMKAIS